MGESPFCFGRYILRRPGVCHRVSGHSIKPVGLLAAAFYAFTVLNIQQSHFFTMDTFFSFFTLLAIYFAVRVSLVEHEPAAVQLNGADTPEPLPAEAEDIGQSETIASRLTCTDQASRTLRFQSAFGIALGCAVASKLSAAPVAFVLPVAFGVVIWRKPAQERRRWLMNAIVYLGMAAFVSILVFRIFQPYAFLGPGFFGCTSQPAVGGKYQGTARPGRR